MSKKFLPTLVRYGKRWEDVGHRTIGVLAYSDILPDNSVRPVAVLQLDHDIWRGWLVMRGIYETVDDGTVSAWCEDYHRQV